ncbi:MAG: hypothetical protein IJX99_04700 [Clostridia bacterium]|nr:hypothetical protein [Clostridia bacterium]
MKKTNPFLNIVMYGLLFTVMLISLTGCGKIKSSSKLIKYIEDEYNIEVELISSEGNQKAKEKKDRYNKVVLIEKDRNITFTAKSAYSPVGMDGSTFWYQAFTSDDYYDNLTASIEDELSNIAEKYDIKLEYLDGMVSSIDYFGTLADEEEQLENIKNALNEIMKVYNLKKEPASSLISTIIININGEYTDYICHYTANGEEVELIDADKQWREEWGIPERLDEDVMKYVNSVYSGEYYIEYCNVIPEYYYNEGVTYIEYTVRNDEERTGKRYRFNFDQYKEDLNNNKQIDMETYVETVTSIVY